MKLLISKNNNLINFFKLFKFLIFCRIPANFRSLVYCTAIREGTEKEWNFASDMYDKEDSPAQRRILQSAMSCTKEPWLIARYLRDQLNETKVRRQDSISGLNYAATKSYANLQTWAFLKANWEEIFEK